LLTNKKTSTLGSSAICFFRLFVRFSDALLARFLFSLMEDIEGESHTYSFLPVNNSDKKG
jgi:hypothetical protein